MFAAKFGQEFLVFLGEKLSQDVLEGVAVHVFPLVFLLVFGSSCARSYFSTFFHHLGLPLWGCFRLSHCFWLFVSLSFLLQWLLHNLRKSCI